MNLPVVAIATLADLMQYLRVEQDPQLAAHLAAVTAYRDRYGV
jgi:orotate phosphoribosyltransferase